ncbi:hypothetical protein CYMTET_6236 [Cymbomonas tetramitiformis]|uniref:DNA replication licensing factor MCM2 n=1 Tax=Cymbomonas tetramitiformis TaxID=36881 RepID=A0AAE0GXI8_9CHLO|nr:hypothetical protein CYMTET_6236 [Cymbomonas tetramitiformis]|eukprot:gene23937-29045_t
MSEIDPFTDNEGGNTDNEGITDNEAVTDTEVGGHTDVEDDGEDLLENMERDYDRNERLDHYESEGLGDEDDADDPEGARARAERYLNERDARQGPTGLGRRLPAAIGDDRDDDDERPRRRRKTQDADHAAAGAMDYEQEEEELADTTIGNYKGSLRDHLAKDSTQRAIMRKFANFLNQYVYSKDVKVVENRGKNVYRPKIEEMCRGNYQSLEVSYLHLSEAEPDLAIWVADAPADMLPLFNQVATDVTMRLYNEYSQIHKEIFVRLKELPVDDKIRDIREVHLNVLIKITGVVTRRTGMFPQLAQVKYDCAKCNFTLGPFFQNSESEVKVSSCPNCQSKGPFTVNVEQTIYRNFQKLVLQESPGSVPAGRLPRQKEIILTNDLIDCARPGEEIVVTGIYTNNFDASLNAKNGFPVFATVVEANHVSKNAEEFAENNLTDEDKREIRVLGGDPQVGKKIIRSVAPSIYGHESIKTALVLSMFGGQEKHSGAGSSHRLRGDINVLLLGDPGVAKSQFLKYVEKTAQRAIYTTGKGASAVGLTAAVHKDPITREWTLEGGALVLADKGTCLIDEFDKMNEQDRVSIHEAMEQQSISVSKAGIVTSLQARCAVIAAANPVGGRYDTSRTFAENVELTEPILSRFDVLCVVKDIVDPVLDERLARFVVNSHDDSHPDKAAEEKEDTEGAEKAKASEITHDMLRKYITYAKRHIHPKLDHADEEKISRVYADLRREFPAGQGVPIAVRHIESMIRLSEAHARMHLRESVNDFDTNVAIRIVLESFIATQKYSVQRTLQKKFKKYLTSGRDFNALILDVLRALVRETMHYDEIIGNRQGGDVQIKCKQLADHTAEYGITDLHDFYESPDFLDNGFQLQQDANVIVFTR